MFSYSGLETIVIPQSVTTISQHAFNGCSTLWHVLYTGTQEEWSRLTVEKNNDPLLAVTTHLEWSSNDTIDPESKACSRCD